MSMSILKRKFHRVQEETLNPGYSQKARLSQESHSAFSSASSSSLSSSFFSTPSVQQQLAKLESDISSAFAQVMEKMDNVNTRILAIDARLVHIEQHLKVLHGSLEPCSYIC